MTNFQTEQLRTFLAVLEEGTFDAAANRLHVSASAVSQRIEAMEQAAGQVLLQRTTPISATQPGAVVHKLARALRQLEADAATELGLSANALNAIAVVVNADSLATWFMDSLARLPAGLAVELLREDEQHSAQLLRTGAAMAAVTATAQPVQGCSSTPLGALEYRAVASSNFMTRWFAPGFSVQAISRVPTVQFDRTDTLQSNFVAEITGGSIAGIQHFIPDTLQFAEAVKMGLGWGLLPEAHCRAGLDAGTLVELVPGHISRVPLFWQRWKIASPALDQLTVAVTKAASKALEQNT